MERERTEGKTEKTDRWRADREKEEDGTDSASSVTRHIQPCGELAQSLFLAHHLTLLRT